MHFVCVHEYAIQCLNVRVELGSEQRRRLSLKSFSYELNKGILKTLTCKGEKVYRSSIVACKNSKTDTLQQLRSFARKVIKC